MDKNNILGCYVSITQANPNADFETKSLAIEQGQLFRSYIWGENGINEVLKTLNHVDYGKDLSIILFQFYVNPIPYMRQSLKEIDGYRKKEKSIGIPIIIDNENFFSKSEEDRYSFLKQAILQKIDLLAEVVKKKKLDTRMDLLKSDIEKILS